MKKTALLSTCIIVACSIIFSNNISYATDTTPAFVGIASQKPMEERLPEGTQKLEQETPVFSAAKTQQPSLEVQQSEQSSYNTGVVLVDDLEIIVGSTQFNQGSSGLNIGNKQDTTFVNHQPIEDKSESVLHTSNNSKVKYSDLVHSAAQKYNLPKELIFAVISVESTFNPNAVSSVGATGLMQLTRDTFDWINKQTKNPNGYVYENLFDPAINIDYGSRLLSMAIKEFGHLNNAIYSYHAGWGSVKKWLKNPDHSSDGMVLSNVPSKITENYLYKVLNAMPNYK